MRISDWSSDVCSSDLQAKEAANGGDRRGGSPSFAARQCVNRAGAPSGSVRVRGGSMGAVFGNPLGQTVFGLQLFLFHARQANIVQRQYAQLRVEHLFVELLVAIVEPTKLDFPVHPCDRKSVL